MSEPGGWTRPEPGGLPAGSPEATGPVGQPAPPLGPPAQPVQPGWGPPPGGFVGGPPLAPRPGIVPLRPLRLGELYDGAFAAVRANPGPALGAAAVAAVLVSALTAVGTGLLEHGLGAAGSSGGLFTVHEERVSRTTLDGLGGAVGGYLATAGVATLVQLVATAVLSGVVTVAVSAAVLGRRTRGRELWRQLRPRLLPLVGLALLSTLLEFVVAVIALAVGFVPGLLLISSGGGGGIVGGVLLAVIGLLLALVASLALTVRLVLAPCALVLEPQPVGRAISRSWRLSRRGFWRLLGVWLLSVVLLRIAAAVIGAVFGELGLVIGQTTASGDGALVIRLVISGIGSAAVLTVVYPLQAAVTALLYVDQRMRQEGLDVDLARAASTPA